ncbi:dynamin family [Fusarium sp. NRRL 52700]|nr:dynamin family [Fusarium sp. NRRL 52700]
MTPRTLSEVDPVERWLDSSVGGIDTPTHTANSSVVGSTSNDSSGLTRKSNPHHDGKYLIYDCSRSRVLTCHNGHLRLEPMDLNKPQSQAPKQALWQCSERDGFRGFKNVAAGTFLGHDIWWDFYAKVYHHKGWEDFTLRHMEGGVYQIQTLDWWTQRQVSAKEDGSGLFRDDHGGTLWEFIKPMTTDGPLSFLSLSGELRNAIYELILLQSEPIDPWLRYGPRVLTALFCVSKTVHHEATLLFYSQNRFDFAGRHPEKIASFLQQIGTRNASSIRHIIIDFPEFRHLDPGDVTIDEESIDILGNILSSCTSLSTLRTSLYSTESMEHRLDNLDDDGSIATEALNLVDTHFRAIPSSPEIILEVYEDRPSDSLRRNMKSYGWVLSENPSEEEEYWDRRFSDADSDDYGYGYDGYNSYNDDEYDIDNDSDFWRRAAD